MMEEKEKKTTCKDFAEYLKKICRSLCQAWEPGTDQQ